MPFYAQCTRGDGKEKEKKKIEFRNKVWMSKRYSGIYLQFFFSVAYTAKMWLTCPFCTRQHKGVIFVVCALTIQHYPPNGIIRVSPPPPPPPLLFIHILCTCIRIWQSYVFQCVPFVDHIICYRLFGSSSQKNSITFFSRNLVKINPHCQIINAFFIHRNTGRP